MTFRQSKLSTWRKYRKPREGQSHAKPTRCLTDHYHHSGLEARVCDELRLRKIAGDLKDYKHEVTFYLEANGTSLGISYRADFVVEENDGTREIIDAKGIFFPMFKLKWKLMQAMYKDDPMTKFRVVTR